MKKVVRMSQEAHVGSVGTKDFGTTSIDNVEMAKYLQS